MYILKLTFTFNNNYFKTRLYFSCSYMMSTSHIADEQNTIQCIYIYIYIYIYTYMIYIYMLYCILLISDVGCGYHVTTAEIHYIYIYIIYILY